MILGEAVIEERIMAALFGNKDTELDGDMLVASEAIVSSSIVGIIRSSSMEMVVRVINGSFKWKFGTAGRILENDIWTEMIVGLIDVPRHDAEYDAYMIDITCIYDIVTAP